MIVRQFEGDPEGSTGPDPVRNVIGTEGDAQLRRFGLGELKRAFVVVVSARTGERHRFVSDYRIYVSGLGPHVENGVDLSENELNVFGNVFYGNDDSIDPSGSFTVLLVTGGYQYYLTVLFYPVDF